MADKPHPPFSFILHPLAKNTKREWEKVNHTASIDANRHRIILDNSPQIH